MEVGRSETPSKSDAGKSESFSSSKSEVAFFKELLHRATRAVFSTSKLSAVPFL